MCKFHSFKSLFAKITSPSKLYFRFRRFILLVQTTDIYELWQQNNQLKTMKTSEGWHDTYDKGYIHQFQPKITHIFPSSSRSTEFKDIFQSNISQITTQIIKISTSIVISYFMKQGIPFWIWRKVNGNWDNHSIRISQWRENHCRTNTSVRRKKIQKSRTLRVTVADPSRKVNHLSKITWD